MFLSPNQNLKMPGKLVVFIIIKVETLLFCGLSGTIHICKRTCFPIKKPFFPVYLRTQRQYNKIKYFQLFRLHDDVMTCKYVCLQYMPNRFSLGVFKEKETCRYLFN